MGVLTQHRQQAAEAGLKTLAHGVELIAPKAGGVNQPQGLQREGPAHQSHCNQPASALGYEET